MLVSCMACFMIFLTLTRCCHVLFCTIIYYFIMTQFYLWTLIFPQLFYLPVWTTSGIPQNEHSYCVCLCLLFYTDVRAFIFTLLFAFLGFTIGLQPHRCWFPCWFFSKLYLQTRKSCWSKTICHQRKLSKVEVRGGPLADLLKSRW